MGCWAWAASLAPGLILGLGLAAGWGCGVAVGSGCCLAVGLVGDWALRCCLAAGFGFGWAVGLSFPGGRCRPALLFAAGGASGVLAVMGALAAGTGLCRCVGGMVLGEDVIVDVDEVVMVVEVAESGREALVEKVEGVDREDAEADDTDVGEAAAAFGSGAAIWVLCTRRVRVRLWASGVFAHFPWCPVCVQVAVLWASCAGTPVVSCRQFGRAG